MTPSQCLHILTFHNDDGPAIASEQFQILVMPGNLTVLVTIWKQCLEGTVRLVGGRDDSVGRLEVCRHGMYGTICNTTWTMENTRVVCNQLGFSDQGREVGCSLMHVYYC